MSIVEDRLYQVAAIEDLRQGFREHHNRQVLFAATGAGKSVVIMLMIQRALEKKSRVLFLCERRVLVEQFSKHLDSSGIDHGVFMAKHWRFRPNELVQVASVQTLERMESWPIFDICFIDEVHACFVAGTLVDGVPIESLRVGDIVNSVNHDTGLIEAKTVTATFRNNTPVVMTIKTEDGQSITCTRTHPIFTQHGYLNADELSTESVLQVLKPTDHLEGSNYVHQEATGDA